MTTLLLIIEEMKCTWLLQLKLQFSIVKWCIYIAPFPYEFSNALYNDQFTSADWKLI